MAKSDQPLAAWMAGRRRATAAKSASGARLTIKKLPSGRYAACKVNGAMKSCGLVPEKATIGELRKLFRRSL